MNRLTNKSLLELQPRIGEGHAAGQPAGLAVEGRCAPRDRSPRPFRGRRGRSARAAESGCDPARAGGMPNSAANRSARRERLADRGNEERAASRSWPSPCRGRDDECGRPFVGHLELKRQQGRPASSTLRQDHLPLGPLRREDDRLRRSTPAARISGFSARSASDSRFLPKPSFSGLGPDQSASPGQRDQRRRLAVEGRALAAGSRPGRRRTGARPPRVVVPRARLSFGPIGRKRLAVERHRRPTARCRASRSWPFPSVARSPPRDHGLRLL